MLSEHETQVLDFAALTYRSPGAREQAIRERFGYSLTRFTQDLIRLLDRRDAVTYAPTTVNRFRRLRDADSRARLS